MSRSLDQILGIKSTSPADGGKQDMVQGSPGLASSPQAEGKHRTRKGGRHKLRRWVLGSLLLVGPAALLIILFLRDAPIRTFQGHKQDVTDLSFSPDSKYLLSSSKDQTSCLWDVSTAAVVRRFGSPDNHGEVLAHSRPGRHDQGSNYYPTFSRFLRGGQQVISTENWSIRTSSHSALIPSYLGIDFALISDVASGTLLDRIHLAGGPFSIGLSEDGQWLWLGGKWLDRATREEKYVPGEGSLECSALSPDRRIAAVAFADGDHNQRHTVRVFDVARGGKMSVIAERGDESSEECWGLAFSLDGSQLAAASNSEIRIWGIDRRQKVIQIDTVPIQLYRPSENCFTCVAFSTAGAQLLSGGRDGMVRLWDVRRKSEICRFRHGRERRPFEDTNAVLCVALSPDECFAASGGGDGLIKLWKLPE